MLTLRFFFLACLQIIEATSNLVRLEEKLRSNSGDGRAKVPVGFFDRLLEILLELSASGTWPDTGWLCPRFVICLFHASDLAVLFFFFKFSCLSPLVACELLNVLLQRERSRWH